MFKIKNNISAEDILQSEKDIDFIREKLKPLDDGIPVPERLSSQYLLRRNEKRRTVWLRPALISGAAALLVIVGLTAGGFLLFATSGFKASSASDGENEAMTVYDDLSSSVSGSQQIFESAEKDASIKEETADVFDNMNDRTDSAEATYIAGSYTDVLSAIESSIADFTHVLTPQTKSNITDNSDTESELTGVIGKIVVSIENTVISQEDAEYSFLCEEIQQLPHSNVTTSGGRRVYSIESEMLGPVVCIDNVASGTLSAAIKLGGDISVEQLLLNNDNLIIIADTDQEFGEIPLGAFGVTIVDIFNLSNEAIPVQTGRYACEGELFTVISDSSGIFAAVKRFAVDYIDFDSFEVEDMSYIPMIMHNDEYMRLSPNDIYISSSMASMDYMIVFRLDSSDSHALAYLGDSDPLHSVNFLIEKFK